MADLDHDSVIILSEQIKNIERKLDNFMADPGLPRCVLQNHKINSIESSLKWIKTTILGAIIGVIAAWFQKLLP